MKHNIHLSRLNCRKPTYRDRSTERSQNASFVLHIVQMQRVTTPRDLWYPHSTIMVTVSSDTRRIEHVVPRQGTSPFAKGVLCIYKVKSVQSGRTQGSSPIPRYPNISVGERGMGAVMSLVSRLCYGITALVCDLVIGCIGWLLINIVKPIVLMLAGLACGLCLSLAIVVQSPIRAAQDSWSVKQSRKEMKKWSHASSHPRHAKLEYRQLASLSSIPSW